VPDSEDRDASPKNPDIKTQEEQDAAEKKAAEDIAKANAAWVKAKKEAREKAEAKEKADKEAKDAADAERRREKGYDDLNATEKQIFRRWKRWGKTPMQMLFEIGISQIKTVANMRSTC
jgi:hypothetical protein